MPVSGTSTDNPCLPQEISMLDVIYIVIGIAAFVATALYLPACDSL